MASEVRPISVHIHKLLIKAINEMANAAGSLPDDWKLSIHFNNQEAWIDLNDPSGKDVEVISGDSGYSHFVDAIDTACEVQKDRNEQS